MEEAERIFPIRPPVLVAATDHDGAVAPRFRDLQSIVDEPTHRQVAVFSKAGENPPSRDTYTISIGRSPLHLRALRSASLDSENCTASQQASAQVHDAAAADDAEKGRNRN